MTSSAQETPARRPHRLRCWLVRLLILLIVAIVAAELFARYKLGLGDPPLMMTDPTIEFLYQPSKTYHRFGNRIAYNQWSMRSEEFPATKSNPQELRILVIGDSVVNGGSSMDQSRIATEVIRSELPARLGGRPVVVGNVSAGKWGPLNMLAYVKRFGLFDADVVIVVLSSHDWNDVPRFEPLGSDMPTKRPLMALQELMLRYLPRYLGSFAGDRGPEQLSPSAEPSDPGVVKSLDAVREMLVLAGSNGAAVAVAQHLQADESMDRVLPGHDAINTVAKSVGADIIQLGPSFEQARRAGAQPYIDIIHPSELGQRVIAKTLMDWIVAVTRKNSPATQASP